MSEPQTPLLLGIDGTCLTTRALVTDVQGRVLGVGTARTSNYHAIGFERATRTLSQAIQQALRRAKLPRDSRFAAACLGISGMDRPADVQLMGGWFRRQNLADRFSIINDCELVLTAGTPDHTGVALICGTGSVCYGRAADGRTIRAGGWGYLLGDEGGAYNIALQALQLATQTADRRIQAQTILKAVLDHWGLKEPEQLLDVVYDGNVKLVDIAQLAPRILALAAMGDGHAMRLVERAAMALARLIETVVEELGLRQPPVALGGSLACAHRNLQLAVLEAARVRVGPVSIVEDPAEGAIILARRLVEESDREPRMSSLATSA